GFVTAGEIQGASCADIRRSNCAVNCVVKLAKAGQTFIESAPFGNVSDPLLDREGVLHHVQAVNQNPPAGRSQYPLQHLDRGAFARTVGTEVTDDLPAFDLAAGLVNTGRP